MPGGHVPALFLKAAAWRGTAERRARTYAAKRHDNGGPTRLAAPWDFYALLQRAVSPPGSAVSPQTA
ncbi:unnamed protein product [Merluccius merluccius]